MQKNKKTKQLKNWQGKFGKDYTLRNFKSTREIDKSYIKKYGTTRTELNDEFLANLSRSVKILEIGSNIGSQLLLLQKMGFSKLYGIEINKKAIELSKKNAKDIYIIEGAAMDIPFKNNYFDLIFTSGVLIHISPKDIKKVMEEIYRCTKKYIWGFEYYADKYVEVPYRGNKDLLWKANFPKLYLDNFKNLKLVKQQKLEYKDDINIDIMFLLKKDEKKYKKNSSNNSSKDNIY